MPVPYIQRSSLIPLPTKQSVPKGRTAGLSHASKPSMNIIPIITPAKELRLGRKSQQLRSSNNKTVNLEISSEVAILDLIPFARQPTVDFNEVPVNSVAIKYVAIRNSLDVEQHLFVKTFPKDDKGFNIDATEFLLAPRTEIFVALSWKPTSLGNVRETITFQDINRHPKRIVLTGCAVPVKTLKSIPRFCNRKDAKISPCKLNRMIKQDKPPSKPPSKPLTNLIFASRRRQSAQIVKKILSKRDDVMATQVQSYFRMILCQRELEDLKNRRTNAAILIQSHWRCLSTRRRYVALKQTTIRLQARWRSQIVRKELKRGNAMATLVQSYFRMILCQRELEDLKNRRTNAAILIQSHWRCLSTRRRYVALKQTTIRLQARWRSQIVRKELKRGNAMATLVQSYFRMILCQRELEDLKNRRTNAAILIQSHWRCLSTRRRYVALKQTTIRLQARWRSQIARKELKRLKSLMRTSNGLQTYGRGYLTRIRLRRSIEALNRIQSRFFERKAILC